MKTTNYINNQDLYNELFKYYERRKKYKEQVGTNLPEPEISNYIGRCILELAERMMTRPNFSGYSQQWKEEMKSDAIRNCVIACKTFDPNKSKNAFGFFSRVAWNGFIHRIKLEKHQTAIKHKNLQRLNIMEGVEVNDEISNQVIESYEKSYLTNKAKATKIKKVKK